MNILFAQSLPKNLENQARLYLLENAADWGLTPEDLAGLKVDAWHQSQPSGLYHLYFQQVYRDIPVHNALLGVHLDKSGQVIYAGNRLVQKLQEKINATEPALDAAAAISIAAQKEPGIQNRSAPNLKSRPGLHQFIFDGGDLAKSEIPVQLVYELAEDGRLQLAWQLLLDSKRSSDYWDVRVDAITGLELARNNYTVYCQFEAETAGSSWMPAASPAHLHSPAPTVAPVAGPQYRVFPFPVESPSHGARILLNDPADPEASPLGWHNTDTIPGADFTITRGNNAHAFLDLKDIDSSTGDEPDGGESLVFDFPYTPDQEPDSSKNAAVTQLFYANNFMHDLSYYYGFTEAAGNFQQNNYGEGGRNGDPVAAHAQDGATAAVPNVNNANFATPPDGGDGVMQMFLWNRNAGTGTRAVRIDAPAAVSGTLQAGLATSWGKTIGQTPVTGQLVEAKDGIARPFFTDGCTVIQNTAELTGKIALIDRGGCEFGTKALNAEKAGAIGVIICNFRDELIGMGAGVDGTKVKIPAVFLSSIDCALLRTYIEEGITISLVTPAQAGPNLIDGSFDNGIMAHEYAHGISNRLTGGPNNVGCLPNFDRNNDGQYDDGEQMGEGWSDFFTLVTTTSVNEDFARGRGIGTFASREGNDGRGFRPYRYATDMQVNPFTYKDISQVSVPHGVGSVWATMLWDLYAKMVELYGYDANLYTGTGGNNKTIQLVMEGLKLQPCNPGFVDGRDAILAADRALFGGAHQCMIWEVFARRGLGFSADQGDPNRIGDGKEGYDLYPPCLNTVVLKKDMTPLIDPGDAITVTLTASNYTNAAVDNLVIQDQIPAGLNVLDAPAGVTSNQSANNYNIQIGSLAPGASRTLTYRLQSPASKFSRRVFLDEVTDETAADLWTLGAEGNVKIEWIVASDTFHSEPYSWFVENTAVDGQLLLSMFEPVRLDAAKPVLRFFHQFDTEAGFDGGLVEISTDLGLNWEDVRDRIFREPYSSSIAYGTFVVPNLSAFTGKSEGFIASYVDLTEYAGQEVMVRFRFGTDENTAGDGWYVDDIEFFDMLNYNAQACISSGNKSFTCSTPAGYGTVVESAIATGTDEPVDISSDLRVFPNPASEAIFVVLNNQDLGEAAVQLLDINGREIQRQFTRNGQLLQMQVGHLPAGMYLVRVRTDKGAAIAKIQLSPR